LSVVTIPDRLAVDIVDGRAVSWSTSGEPQCSAPEALAIVQSAQRRALFEHLELVKQLASSAQRMRALAIAAEAISLTLGASKHWSKGDRAWCSFSIGEPARALVLDSTESHVFERDLVRIWVRGADLDERGRIIEVQAARLSPRDEDTDFPVAK
jgi:hypothetical protein